MEQESGKDSDTCFDEEKDERNDKKSRNGGSSGGGKGKDRGGDRGGKSGGDRGSGGRAGQKRTSGQKGRSGPLFAPGFDFDFALEQATSLEPEEQLGYLMQVCEPHFLCKYLLVGSFSDFSTLPTWDLTLKIKFSNFSNFYRVLNLQFAYNKKTPSTIHILK